MSLEPTIQPIETNSAIYILTDSRGNLMSVGSPEALEILLHTSQRCGAATFKREPIASAGANQAS